MDESPRQIARALVRFNARVLGLTVGLLAAAGLFVATLVLVLHGGENPGAMLGVLSSFFPGYRVSVGGAVIGALWAGLFAYVGAAIFARAYGPWLVRAALRNPGSVGPSDELENEVAMISPLAATTAGLLLAGAMFAAHNWLTLRSGTPAEHLDYLGLLVNYLPGYRMDFVGGLVGAFWVSVYGAAAAFATAWLYNRIARARKQ